MDLMESISFNGNVRGIALNSQNIDLFNIIEQAKSHEEVVEKVNKYLDEILQANIMSRKMNSQNLSTAQKIKRVISEKEINVSNKGEFYKFILENAMQIRANWDSKEKLEKIFENKTVDNTYIDEILKIKKYFTYQTQGILTFLVDKEGQTIDPESTKINIDRDKTYQKVEALYKYITGNLENGEKRFNRLTLDSQGKFGTVAGVMRNENEATAKPKDYNLEPLKQGYEFAKKHNMDVRINALVFFKDFPDRLVGQDKNAFRTAVINYGKAVASVVNEYKQNGISTTIDMFNEFVDYNEPFLERTNNWMSKLSVEDLCEVALEIKNAMPDAHFGYNDWNFENSDKRKSIFLVIKKIQEFEKENNCKIIDHIGTQCHTSINDIEGLIDSIEELQQFGLPIDITELDISKGLDGVDEKKATTEELEAIKKYEQNLQNELMKMLSNFVEKGKIRGITCWSVTDELCCDFCDGKEASITGMSYDKETGFNFSGKDMDKTIEMTKEEMQLIKDHRARILENKQKAINQNPIQDFCYHTHTQRCGHGAKDTGDIEFVENAIKGGMKKLAFTDHMPLPDRMNHTANSRMDIAEVESYLESIEYLKEKYQGKIEIETGFEFEYSDRDLVHLQDLKSRTDKMVLGQHFVIDDKGNEIGIQRENSGKQISDNILEMYEDSIISAMDKGLPDIIAHPDIFMQARDNFDELEEKITREICRKAIEKEIPLEINFGKIASRVESGQSIEQLKKSISYPSPEFWKVVVEETKIAKENGENLNVIFGKDAHFPEQLSEDRDYQIAVEIIGKDTLEQLHFVKNDLRTYDEEMLDKLEIRKDGQSGAAAGDHYAVKQDDIHKEETTINEYGEIIRPNNTKEFSIHDIGKKVVLEASTQDKKEAEVVERDNSKDKNKGVSLDEN